MVDLITNSAQPTADHDLLVRCDEKLGFLVRTVTDSEKRVDALETKVEKMQNRMAMAAGALLVIQFIVGHLWAK